jgi:hypothetical protein
VTTTSNHAAIMTSWPGQPRPSTGGEIPESLVDLMPVVNRSRSQGIHAAFGLVRKAP